MLLKRKPRICFDVLSITNSKSEEVRSPAVPYGFSSASSEEALIFALNTL